MFHGATAVVAVLVLIATGIVALGVIFQKIIRPLWRFAQWVRHELRDEMGRRQKVDAIIERELTHNGGSSMKDHTTYNEAAIRALTLSLEDVKDAQETFGQLLDNVVERKGEDHEAIWHALQALGAHRPTETTDKENP